MAATPYMEGCEGHLAEFMQTLRLITPPRAMDMGPKTRTRMLLARCKVVKGAIPYGDSFMWPVVMMAFQRKDMQDDFWRKDAEFVLGVGAKKAPPAGAPIITHLRVFVYVSVGAGITGSNLTFSIPHIKLSDTIFNPAVFREGFPRRD